MKPEKPKLLGVYITGQGRKIGSMFAAIVGVDSNSFFRKFSRLKINRNKFTNKEIEDIHEVTKTSLWFDIIGLKPNDIKGNLKDLEVRLILESLNRYPKFWNQKVHISSQYEILEDLEKSLPHNLKHIRDSLNLNNWIIEPGYVKNVLALARVYGLWASQKELEEIKKIWDVDSKDFFNENEDCPHIRRTKWKI